MSSCIRGANDRLLTEKLRTYVIDGTNASYAVLRRTKEYECRVQAR